MVVKHIQRILEEKSRKHRADLKKLRLQVAEERLSDHVLPMPQTPQLVGMGTIVQDRDTDREEFIFYFDRLSALLIERYASSPLPQV
jgi:uridine kinase